MCVGRGGPSQQGGPWAYATPRSWRKWPENQLCPASASVALPHTLMPPVSPLKIKHDTTA